MASGGAGDVGTHEADARGAGAANEGRKWQTEKGRQHLLAGQLLVVLKEKSRKEDGAGRQHNSKRYTARKNQELQKY